MLSNMPDASGVALIAPCTFAQEVVARAEDEERRGSRP